MLKFLEPAYNGRGWTGSATVSGTGASGFGETFSLAQSVFSGRCVRNLPFPDRKIGFQINGGEGSKSHAKAQSSQRAVAKALLCELCAFA